MLGDKKNIAAALGLAALLWSSGSYRIVVAQDDVRYIIDTVIVTIRNEPSDDADVLARVSSGDRVLVTGLVAGDYEQISLDDGTIGWVGSQYLSGQRIAKSELQALRADYQALQQLYEQNLEAQTQSEQSLIRLSDDFRIVNEELEQFRRSAGNPTEMEQKLERLRERLALSEADSERLLRLNKELTESSETRWFLIGAGVLLAGIVLGMAIPRGRKRHTSWDRF